MSVIGTKRTYLFALHMSAFDPKRISGPAYDSNMHAETDLRAAHAMRAPLTSSPTIQRHEKNRRALHPFYIAAVAAVLIMQVPNAHAQHGSAPSGPSEKEKAKAQEKRIFEKDTDEAYKSTLSRIPDAKQPKVDPWGSMRTAPQK